MNKPPEIIEEKRRKPPFRLSDRAISDFARLYKKHYGIVLNDDEADMMGRRLIGFCKMLSKK